MQLAINDATAAAATANRDPKKPRGYGRRRSRTRDKRRHRRREKRERERARTRDAEKPFGRAGRTGRKTGPGKQTTRSQLQDRAGLPWAGTGSLTTTNLDGSTNCQPPGWAVARLISCCPARKLKYSFARVKQHPSAHHPLDA